MWENVGAGCEGVHYKIVKIFQCLQCLIIKYWGIKKVVGWEKNS